MAKPGQHGNIDWDAVYTAHGQNFLMSTPVDNYFTSNPTLDYLKKETGDGGASVHGDYLIVPLIHTKQSNVQSVGRLEQASLTTTDPVTAAEYRLKEYVCYVTISAFDEKRATGMDSRLNLVETYIDNARKSAEKTLSEHLLASSKAKSTDIDPLADLISTAGTGTVGGINSSTSTWWQNKQDSVGAFGTYGLDKMRKMMNDVSAGNQGKRPGMIVTTQAIWEAYVDQAEGKTQLDITPGKAAGRIADLGFPVATYQGIPMTWDPSAESGKMYFLNPEGIQFRATPWKLSPFQDLTSSGIDGRVARLSCWVAVTVAHRRILGVLHTIS
jgi:hypothetical protein